MLNFDDKLVRIPMPIIATLAPSQDTTSDQLAAFYRQPGIPFTRHSPLPVAASAPTNALINSAKKLLILLALLICAGRTQAATNPAVIVSASSISITGASQPISITVNLIDPNNTGMLTVAGTGIVPSMRATSPTPGTTVTVGPIYGNDVILNGYGEANTTYYQVSVYTVNGGTVSSTPSLQQFYALTGSGTIDLSTATPLAPSFMSAPLGVSIPGNLSVGGTGTFYGALSALGGLTTTSFTVSGATTVCKFNSVFYVGGSCASTWGGGDIGAQINGAYTLLPATGGTIFILPQDGGACYNFATSIVFGTVGKPVNLIGVSPPSNSSGTVETGSCLNWTSASGVAMVMDWTPSTGGGSPGGGMSNVTLWDNGCTTNGGCGNTAAGLSVGPTNSGAMGATFSKVKFRGWGSGLYLQANAAALSFPLWFNNFTFQQNTIGVNSAQATEGWHFSTGLFIQNGTGFAQDAPNTQIGFNGVHWDGNTAVGFTGSNCTGVIATFVDNHFENNGGTTTHYVSCGGLGDMLFEGGLAIDDTGTGNTDFWFNAANFIGNLKIASVGRTATAVFVGTMISLNVLNGNPSVLTTVNNGITTNSLAQPAATTWAGNTSCATSTKTVTFGTAFINAPIVMLSDRTTAGGARLTAVSPPGFTVACTGATDNFDWLAVGNPN